MPELRALVTIVPVDEPVEQSLEEADLLVEPGVHHIGQVSATENQLAGQPTPSY